MKNITRPLQLISAILFLCFSSHGYAEEIKSGAYTLELDISALAEERRKTELKGALKSGGDGFTFETKGAMGNGVTIDGKVAGDRVVMWVTREEQGHLVTFHYTGQLSKEEGVSATGELSLFTRHQKTATGTWALRTRELATTLDARDAAVPDFSEGMPNASLEKKEIIDGKETYHLKTVLSSKEFSGTLRRFLGDGWNTRTLTKEEMVLASTKGRALNAVVNLSVYENAKLPAVEIRVIHFKYKGGNTGPEVEIMIIRQEPDFPRAKLEAVVAQLRAKSMDPGRVHRFRLKHFPSPSSLRPLKDDEHLKRGEGRGLVWAEVSPKGVLKAAFETRDSGHAGESGVLYSDTPVTTADIDELGREWKLGRRISKHWWVIIYDLG